MTAIVLAIASAVSACFAIWFAVKANQRADACIEAAKRSAAEALKAADFARIATEAAREPAEERETGVFNGAIPMTIRGVNWVRGAG